MVVTSCTCQSVCYFSFVFCCVSAFEIMFTLLNLTVIFEAKDMHNLLDYFGGLWTEGAQYKISRVKKRYAYALAYRGELMDALKHVNRYLGGNISFISDDFESFEGLHAGAALTDEKRLTGHSGRCFVVKLTRFST
ncbi:hypothetical protein SETIT_6G021500v2 [Setaria italica]|uniref:Uncharacterized protein n=1 Tax=Setaria italica TaxID=4555 RepID=A0A368RH45_SETIT|nr:hypothetical protein SETIT_6G021500v2 [Setaria italica]